jgi:hypothetical protein
MEDTKDDLELEMELVEIDISSEINAACNAYSTVEEIDTKLLDKGDANMVKRIRYKALAIIDRHIAYLYDRVLLDD